MSHPFHHHQPWRQFKNTIFEWNWNESDSPLLNLDKEKTILEHLRNKTDLNGVNENIESIYMHLISKMSNRRKWNRRNSRSTSNSFNDRNDFEKRISIFLGDELSTRWIELLNAFDCISCLNFFNTIFWNLSKPFLIQRLKMRPLRYI